jgi:hypothetical protein
MRANRISQYFPLPLIICPIKLEGVASADALRIVLSLQLVDSWSITMRFGRIALVSLAIAFAIVAVSASAAAGTATINPGSSYVLKVKFDASERVRCSWYISGGSGGLHFVLTDPENVTLEEGDAIGGVVNEFSHGAGTYTFTWTNRGSSVVTLSYTMPNGDIENAVNWILLVVLVMVIIIVAVVLIVIVLVTKKKKAPGQAKQVISPNATQAIASGRCPQCGRPVDPNGLFCAVCNAKLR